jgi:hypothetical protein
MYGQLDLEVICNIMPKIERASNFHDFSSEKLHYKKDSSKNLFFHFRTL